MKQITTTICVLILLLGNVVTSSASLIQYSTDVVLDDQGTSVLTDDLYFYRDLSRFSDLTYTEQLASITLLASELDGFGPWANWHLASVTEMSNVFSDFVSVPDVFLASSGSSFTGRFEDSPGAGAHYAYEVYVTGGSPPITHEIYEVSDSSAYPLMGAWAVAGYRPLPVPEPLALLLLVAGFAVIGFIKLIK